MSTPEEQTEEIREAVAEDATTGIAATTVDGLSVQSMHPMTRLDVADRIKRNSGANNPFARMRSARIISPGAGE